MPVEIVTKQDLLALEQRLLGELQKIMDALQLPPPGKTWLRTDEVRMLLKISDRTLQRLRNNGTLKYTRIGQVLYYDNLCVRQLLNTNVPR